MKGPWLPFRHHQGTNTASVYTMSGVTDSSSHYFDSIELIPTRHKEVKRAAQEYKKI